MIMIITIVTIIILTTTIAIVMITTIMITIMMMIIIIIIRIIMIIVMIIIMIVGSRYLPYAVLPLPEGPEEAERMEVARRCLGVLGVQTTLTPQGLLRCLKLVRAGDCQDVEIFADLYKHLAQAEVKKKRI